MNVTTNEVVVEVWGPMACFTRPEFKVERVSYEVMTPSAARGVIDAICWRKEMRWAVTRIEVLSKGRFASVSRNEVKSKIPMRSVEAAMVAEQNAGSGKDAGGGLQPLDVIADHTPRASLVLLDVKYRIVVRAVIIDAAEIGRASCRERV